MFQYASLLGIASNREFEWGVPAKESFGSHYPLRSNLYDCFELGSVEVHEDHSLENLSESIHGFDRSLFDSCPDNVNLNGYLQSYLYFRDIESEIREDFSFKAEVVQRGEEFCSSLPSEYISMHFRKTDYMALQDHMPPLPMSYYEEALHLLDDSLSVVVSSDDIGWCREQPELGSERFIFSENNSYVDLYTMTKAKANIIANSTFSWWGAWLNKDSYVIMPNSWFGPAVGPFDMDNFTYPGWITL